MTIVDVSPRAAQDLLDITESLADYSEASALEFIATYDGVIEDLRDFPDIGRLSELEPPTRIINRGRYLFIYERVPNLVRLLRIKDGRRGATLRR